MRRARDLEKNNPQPCTGRARAIAAVAAAAGAVNANKPEIVDSKSQIDIGCAATVPPGRSVGRSVGETSSPLASPPHLPQQLLVCKPLDQDRMLPKTQQT